MLWFGDTLVDIRVAHDDGSDGISVIESLAPCGDSPPYHVHHSEDESFTVLDGELELVVDGETLSLRPGESRLAPKGVPHTYRVVSEAARWLVVTTHGDFERFVRAASRPAERIALPEPMLPPTTDEQGTFAELASRYSIELLGPAPVLSPAR